MEQRLDRQPSYHRSYWRSYGYRRYLLGGITAGGEPADQTPAEPEPEPQGPEKVSYDFTSYSADGETEYATGVAETTGNTKTFDSKEYVEVEVKENSEAEWVGNKYYIAADAVADGETKYDLYDAEGQAVGVKVTITAHQG